MRRILKWTAIVVGAVVGLGLVVIAGFYLWLRASLPQLDGELRLAGLAEAAHIVRDDLGVPTVRASDRLDAALATGFLHAQDRFFQMDLLRRRSAGELAELLGPAVLGADLDIRVHRFRTRSRRALEVLEEPSRSLLRAYTEGVNAGLETLAARPPEYLLLRSEPAAWRPEDSLLVLYTMYIRLQDEHARRESWLGLMHDTLPGELVRFLVPRGTEWEAPLVGEPFATPPVPAPDVCDLRPGRPADKSSFSQPADETVQIGSNNWAVAGSLTADGGALMANDMHLGHSMPNIWYRASLVWADESAPDGERRATGVMLPGAPMMIAGSNGQVAWGFTNSYVDSTDLVVLEESAGDDSSYLTPQGPRRFERHQERIAVRGAKDERLEVLETIWGPVIDRDHQGRRRALRWIAHDERAAGICLNVLQAVADLPAAQAAAHGCGIPTQNFVAVDRSGRIGWTLMGLLPRRVGFDGTRPESWADGSRRWDGWLDPDEYPRVIDPPSGRIWTANNRVVGGEALERLGDGGYGLGARARQIRDGLFDLEQADAAGMLAIQLDDRALFLERWRELLLGILTPEALRDQPRRQELRRYVEEGWSGRASVDSVGYRLVRAFRGRLAERVFAPITAPCREIDAEFSLLGLGSRFEGPLWRLIEERPAHLLDPVYTSWDEALLATVDALLDQFLVEQGSTLATQTWGARNTVRIRHPLSGGVPRLADWLDMPPRSLPGDTKMPRVQGTLFGASERFVVSPGREERGFFHMPGGQSGHPLSPFYRNGHDSWATGARTPFLPGATRHRLVLIPSD